MSGSAPPAGGMQRIPFPTESYQHPSPPLSSKYLLNVMVERSPDDARTASPLIATPGLALFQTIGSGPINAMNDDSPGTSYLVSGTRFYRIRWPAGPPIVDDLGDIGAPATDVISAPNLMYTIASGTTGVVVCVPPNAFVCGHAPGDMPNQIGGTFPGAATVAYHDGYFVYTSYNNDAQFFISRLNDPADFDALDFAYSDAVPNVLRRVVSFRTDLWLMGEGGIEVWYDAGLPDFPYRRRAGGVIPFQLASARSVALGDLSVWWVNYNDVVFRSNAYQAVRVSTHAVEEIIRAHGSNTVESAFCYGQRGHICYVLNFTDRTLVYDSSTQKWHDRGSVGARWRANATLRSGPTLLFGDDQSGNVYYGELDAGQVASENGAPILRQIVLPPLFAGTNRAFCSRLEVEMESGNADIAGGAVYLDWSDDGGFTWNGGPRTMAAAFNAGGRRQRVVATRLGSFRQRVFRLTFQGATTVYAVDAAITGGNGG